MATKAVPFFNAALVFFALSLPSASPAQVPKTDRNEIDHIVGAKGTYMEEEGVYKLVFPREAATVVLDYQTLPSTLGLNTWAAFSPAKHHPALMTGEFLLLQDEVDSVIGSALNANLEVTGLADTTFFDGPPLKTLDVSGVGTYRELASALRRVLDETRRIAKERALPNVTRRHPSVSLESSITPGPIDEILSMHGMVLNGIYGVAIGRRGIIYGEPAGREMGFSTWISVSGSDEQALAHGEIIATAGELQTILRSLSSVQFHVIYIRNHFVAERPTFYFVRFWKNGRARDIAHSLRSTLEAQIRVSPESQMAEAR
jgi:hypothetical protein